VTQPTSEFRFKKGIRIRQYISQFSSTEKVIFGILTIVALVTALILVTRVNRQFMINVPAHGGELREGVVGLPRTVNPVIAITDVDRDLGTLIYSGLTKYDASGTRPDIAKNWEISDDGLTYTFNLREDVYFQDGKPLTADDVVFTIQKIQDPAIKSPRRSDWTNVSVKQITPTQVQFTLKQAYAPFLTNTTVGIIPKHIWGSVSDEQFIYSQFNTEPVGTGPFKLSSVSRDNGGIPTEYHLKTWTKYYNKRPYLDAITLQFFADEEKALQAIGSGLIDSLASISPSEAARLASNTAESYKVLSSHLPRVFSVFFNQAQSPVLADSAVRQALDIAVDRDALVQSVLNGYGAPIHGPLPGLTSTSSFLGNSKTTPTVSATSIASSTAASTLATTSPTQVNYNRAETILLKAGWKKNEDGIYQKTTKTGNQLLSFDIYTADSPDLKKAAESVKAAWTAIGAQVGIKIFESSDLYQNVIRTRKYDALLFGQFIGKDRDLYAFWHSSQRNSPGLNVAQYTNSKADKLLEQIRSTHDENVLASLYKQFDEIVENDLPAIFLYVPDFIYVVPKRLQGINLGAVTVPSDRFESMNDWYVNTDGVWKILVR
jgi:peptide/nickel transport system substrate-binding protein